ncbi:M20/M25/M40 family metallo-hydrolase [Lacisediminihabitans sp. FW035]
MPGASSLLDDIRTLVETESPSDDLAAVAASAAAVADVGTRLLESPPESIVIDGRTHLRWAFGDASRVLVLCHHDTVWPVGSIENHPFTERDGVLRGPGVFDMKAGLVVALHAVASLSPSERMGVTILVTGDEEIGSPSSRELIEGEARGAAAALVLEASADGGALKIERKGVSRYEVRVTGRAAHAGLEPERGVNASLEIAAQIIAVAKLADLALGTTVTPTVVWSGTTTNTVPGSGTFAVDVRARSRAEQDRVEREFRNLRPTLSGAVIAVDGGPNRPPLEREMALPLFERAQLVATALGMSPLTSAAVGGGSDGNFTAGVGTPTLDGLGAVGGGAHADNEHVLVEYLNPQVRFLTALISDLLASEQL